MKYTRMKETFGITIDVNFSIDCYMTDLCRKTSPKIHTLCSIASCMTFNKKQTLLKKFITPQFNCSSLV